MPKIQTVPENTATLSTKAHPGQVRHAALSIAMICMPGKMNTKDLQPGAIQRPIAKRPF